MKIIQILVTITFMTFIGCIQNKKLVNHFNSLNDTLIIQTEKNRGYGMILQGESYFDILDTIENQDFKIIVPVDITQIKVAKAVIDFKPFWYRNLRDVKSDYLLTFLKDYFPSKIDTLNIPSIKDNTISIITGLRGKDTIFIVDENNNKDFRDDSIRLLHRINSKSTSQLIKCKYKIYNGEKMVEDSSWVNLGTDRNNKLSYKVAHYLKATLFIDHQKYEIHVVNGRPFSRFCFDSPILAITEQNEIKKDTLQDADLLKKEDYLKLGNEYYRFKDVSNDGKYITLIKESNFNKKIGVQVGMLAPEFNCKSISGESIRLRDYRGKYLLIVNVSTCWSEESSYKCYRDIAESYKNKLEFLVLDNSQGVLRNNIKILRLEGKFIVAEENDTSRLKAYRPVFCSRTCFLINPDGRIMDKFEIFNWKRKMKEVFAEHI